MYILINIWIGVISDHFIGGCPRIWNVDSFQNGRWFVGKLFRKNVGQSLCLWTRMANRVDAIGEANNVYPGGDGASGI